ncbi:hypothetical protein IWW40_004441 [Coemansia sp. RSA 1250]|nr:hypothetical protein IWW40_004441 [Coemansia sp. RSA 1250]
MAVDTRQAAAEYERTVEYVRRLCQGEDMENSQAEAAEAGGSTAEKAANSRIGTRRLLVSQKPGKLTAAPSGRRSGTQATAEHDACDACGQPGQFICCERCPRVYHFLCVEPPMTKEMVSKVEHWYCRTCAHQRSKKRKSRAHAKNILFPLISNMEYSNPRTFSVPDEIRRSFDGVEADTDGSYINVREDRPQRAHMGAANRDFWRLVDDHNQPILCYRCQLSALHGAVVRCDYCPLSWHWDCLDPPLSSAPPPHRRWMCPNHADHAMRRHHKFRKERIVDHTNASAFARNSGIIDIIDDDPPWHEICDPKVRYRTTSSRIRTQFTQNAHSAVLSSPSPVTIDCEQPSGLSLDDMSCANTSADKLAVLSTVANLVLDSSLPTPPKAAASQHARMLSEHGLTTADMEAALDRLIAKMPSDSPPNGCHPTQLKRRASHGSKSSEITPKRLKLLVNDDAGADDSASKATRARALEASAMVVKLLKAKGSSTLLSYLLND